MLEKTLLEYLNAQLFSSPDHHAYAIIDGATAPGLMLQLNSYSEQSRCLYLGELSESLRATAPYLIKIERNGHVTERLLNHWGQNQGIYAILPSHIEFDAVYKHCRTLLRIKDTDNQTLYFRYSDPRTLKRFFAYASPEQARRLFGPIQFFLLETTPDTEQDNQNQQNSGILRYWETDAGVTQAPITIEPEPESDWPFAQTINTLEPEELEWRAQHAKAHQTRMEHAQASRSGLGMLVIDIPKMQQQRLMNETDFIQWYSEDYMPEHLPDIAQAFSAEERQEMVKKARHTALQQGFNHPSNQAVFVTLMWEVGPDFYQFPNFKTIINAPNLSEEERTDQLYDVTEADKKIAFNKADHRIWFQEDVQ